MDTTRETDEQDSRLLLTRMIYAFCAGVICSVLLDYIARFLFFARDASWQYRFDLWYYITNLCFVAAMFVVAVAYRFRLGVFCWEKESTPNLTSGIKSVLLGVLGGAIALLISSPIVWFGWESRPLRSIQSLIATALSPLPVLNLLFVVLALAFSSEIVFRGIVFRTLARYTTIPAAALASCLLFAYIFPVLGIVAAMILGVTSSILYYQTRNLIAPILANALFTVGCSGIALYHHLK